MRSIEEHIRRAMEEGQFDNLPGRGKPLNLEDDPHADPEWRLAHHLLKSNGFTLPWIEKRQEIEAGLEAARRSLRGAWDLRGAGKMREAGPASAWLEAEWQRALESFNQQIAVLNKRVASYNLEVPSPLFQILPLDAQRELESVTKQAQQG